MQKPSVARVKNAADRPELPLWLPVPFGTLAMAGFMFFLLGSVLAFSLVVGS